MKTKICFKCDREQPFANFRKHPEGKYGLHSYCRECEAEYRKTNREKLRKHDRKRQLQRLYGLRSEEYDELLNIQNGVCAGCGATEFNGKSYHLAVDHDHETGTIRGLLCLKCNRILGLAQDNPDLLRKLADYLEHGVAEVGSQTLRNKNGRGVDVRLFGAVCDEASKMAEERRPSELVI